MVCLADEPEVFSLAPANHTRQYTQGRRPVFNSGRRGDQAWDAIQLPHIMTGELSTAFGITIALTLLLRIGQVLLIGGSVRSKNSAATAMRLLLDLALAALTLWAVGAFFYPSATAPHGWPVFWHFLGMRANGAFAWLPAILIASGVIHAATAERVRGGPLLATTAVFAALVVPLLARLDPSLRFAESAHTNRIEGIACILGGAAALTLAHLVGPRKGKYNRDLSVNFVPGHNVLLHVVGLATCFAAWMLIGNSSVHVLVGGSAAMLTAAAFGRIRFGKVDVALVTAGTIGGLAAVVSAPTLTSFLVNGTPAVVPGFAALLVGVAAGVVVPFCVMAVETRFRIDDLSGIATAHLAGGVLGLPLVGLLTGGTFGQRLSAFFSSLLVALIAAAAGAALAMAVAFVARRCNALRVSESEEFDGADLSELDLNGYPDFQQNMIKSYHLREM